MTVLATLHSGAEFARMAYPNSAVALHYKPGFGVRARLLADPDSAEFVECSGWCDSDLLALLRLAVTLGQVQA